MTSRKFQRNISHNLKYRMTSRRVSVFVVWNISESILFIYFSSLWRLEKLKTTHIHSRKKMYMKDFSA